MNLVDMYPMSSRLTIEIKIGSYMDNETKTMGTPVAKPSQDESLDLLQVEGKRDTKVVTPV